MTALQSMTGFARSQGEFALPGGSPQVWGFELRSVNSRGLDLKFRLPGGLDALEPVLREAVQKAVRRGAVSVSLSVKRTQAAAISVDRAALEQALALATELAARIPGAAAISAEALLGLPGVLKAAAEPEGQEAQAALLPVLKAGFEEALAALVAARRAEGARIAAVIEKLLGEIAGLHAAAVEEAAGQAEQHRARLAAQLGELIGRQAGAGALSEERIAQEIALLATKSDVREETDRLESHIAAARALLAEGVAIGRKFDFLVQEFVREANTLCSKSASMALTAIGLKLKAAIEQLREQVQNVE